MHRLHKRTVLQTGSAELAYETTFMIAYRRLIPISQIVVILASLNWRSSLVVAGVWLLQILLTDIGDTHAGIHA